MMAEINPSSDLEALVRSLKATRAGGGYSARCPAHDDKRNSLSIGLRDGKLYWHCHAGCSQEAVFEAFVSNGWIEKPAPRPTGRHLRSYEGGKNGGGNTLGTLLETYDYNDLNGELVHQTLKFKGKQFRQRRPNKDGGWSWKLDGITPILYRLKEVVEAETVFVVEGEKDVENLRAIGLIATTNPMGAGKWRDSYSEALVGKHVIVLPDNDDVGRRHADKVASSALAAGCKSVRVVELPGLPDHGDVSDWLEKGNDRGKLEDIVRKTTPWSRDGLGDPSWRTRLIKGDKGPVGNEANVEVALRYCPDLVGRLRFDDFRTQLQCRNMPWDTASEWRDWRDLDDAHLAIFMQREEVNIQPHRVTIVAEAVGRNDAFHPIRDYLEALKWDGKPRVKDWLLTYVRCKIDSDNMRAYLRAIGLRFLVGACARVMVPGCKLDTVLTIEGKQGIGKSTLGRVLFSAAWFTDQIADFSNKDYAVDLRGKWCVELAELSVVSRADERVVKSIVSRQTDHYRPPYGRRSIDVDRQNVFYATTNKTDYLGDETGNRRYHPLYADSIDLVALARDRDQLWAEALHLFREGERWHLDEQEDALAREQQALRVDSDPWEDFIDDYIHSHTKDYVTTYNILVSLGFDREKMRKPDEMRVARHLVKRGWERTAARIDGRPIKVYRRRTD